MHIFKDIFKKLIKNRLGFIGFCVFSLVVIAALFAPQIVTHNPLKTDVLNRLKAPSRAHIFGTDGLGRDIFSRVIYGTRYSLTIGIVAILLGVLGGGVLGLTAGYFGGKIESVIMRMMDILLAFPGVLLALAIVTILGAGFINVMFAVGVWSIPVFSRIIRSSVLQIKSKDFIIAAKAVGAGNIRTLFKHVVPGCIPPILILSSLRVGTAILSAASLSYLGLGAQPPIPEWGAMLRDAQQFLRMAPHVAIFPGVSITITVMGLNFLGDALRDILDPKLK